MSRTIQVSVVILLIANSALAQTARKEGSGARGGACPEGGCQTGVTEKQTEQSIPPIHEAVEVVSVGRVLCTSSTREPFFGNGLREPFLLLRHHEISDAGIGTAHFEAHGPFMGNNNPNFWRFSGQNCIFNSERPELFECVDAYTRTGSRPTSDGKIEITQSSSWGNLTYVADRCIVDSSERFDFNTKDCHVGYVLKGEEILTFAASGRKGFAGAMTDGFNLRVLRIETRKKGNETLAKAAYDYPGTDNGVTEMELTVVGSLRDPISFSFKYQKPNGYAGNFSCKLPRAKR